MGLLVGALAALFYFRPLAEALHDHIHLPQYLRAILSFGLIFLTLGLLFFFLGQVLTTLFKIMLLGGVNRIGGAVLGIIQGAVILSTILPLLAIDAMPVGVRTLVHESCLARPLLGLGRVCLAWGHPGVLSMRGVPQPGGSWLSGPKEHLQRSGARESGADDS